MELRNSSTELLQTLDKEILMVSKKISHTITSDNFSYEEIDQWINLLNDLIRHLDHTVEELLSLKNNPQSFK